MALIGTISLILFMAYGAFLEPIRLRDLTLAAVWHGAAFVIGGLPALLVRKPQTGER